MNTIQTVTKVVSDTKELPPVVMKMFSDDDSAKLYAILGDGIVYYVTKLQTYFVAYHQAEAVK